MLTLLEKITLYLNEDGEGVAMPSVGTTTTDIAPNPNKFVIGSPERRRKKKKKKKVDET